MNRKALREKFLKMAKEKAAAHRQREDLYLIQLERSYEDLAEIANRLYERLEEWFGIYFPELKLKDRREYVEAVLAADRAKAESYGGPRAEKVRELLKKSRGADLKAADVEKIKELASLLKSIYDLLDEYEEHIEAVAQRIMPNAYELVGGKLVAKYLSHAGSLEKLAEMPASTVQVLGAEKALFKHLRSKGKVKPPKHGIILLSNYVSSLPKKLRGKMARSLAAKLAIAFKGDVAGHYIAKELKKAVEERYRELKNMKVPQDKRRGKPKGRKRKK